MVNYVIWYHRRIAVREALKFKEYITAVSSYYGNSRQEHPQSNLRSNHGSSDYRENS